MKNAFKNLGTAVKSVGTAAKEIVTAAKVQHEVARPTIEADKRIERILGHEKAINDNVATATALATAANTEFTNLQAEASDNTSAHEHLNTLAAKNRDIQAALQSIVSIKNSLGGKTKAEADLLRAQISGANDAGSVASAKSIEEKASKELHALEGSIQQQRKNSDDDLKRLQNIKRDFDSLVTIIRKSSAEVEGAGSTVDKKAGSDAVKGKQAEDIKKHAEAAGKKEDETEEDIDYKIQKLKLQKEKIAIQKRIDELTKQIEASKDDLDLQLALLNAKIEMRAVEKAIADLASGKSPAASSEGNSTGATAAGRLMTPALDAIRAADKATASAAAANDAAPATAAKPAAPK
jgi:hypothetical protein